MAVKGLGKNKMYIQVKCCFAVGKQNLAALNIIRF